MEDGVDQALRPTRYLLLVIGSFGIMAVAITVVGLYGLLRYRVQEDEYNIAMRLALGAPRQLLVRTQAARGLYIALTGVALGVAAMVLLKPLALDLLPMVQGSIGRPLLIVVILTLAIGAITSLVPAYHVFKVDPSQVGRQS